MQKLAEICIRRPVFATMLIMALVVIGGASYIKLGVDLFPKVDFPVVAVTTVLPGSSPEEIETEITKKVEEACNTASGIDEMRSVSLEGVSQVFVTFVLERDPAEAAQDIRDRVGRIVGTLPRDIDPPVIEKMDPDAFPVVSIAISAARPTREITEISDKQIKQSLESLNGVGQVRFVGDRKREIHIWLNPDKLRSYNLTIDEVRRALASQNVEIPGGWVEHGIQELTLRTLGRVHKVEEFNDIILKTVNGSPVRVSDVAVVEDGVEEPRSLARLNGKEAIVLEVRKQSGTNTLSVVAAVKERLDDLKRILPPDFKILILRDQSTFVQNSFDAVQEHLILGGLFAALVCLLFIANLRATLIAAIAIPTSIISTYTLMWYMGFTLNNMTMLALTLSVGIVIDDAVVVLENIFRFIEEKNMPPMQAAKEATADIGLAVMATTMSLVIIFLPVAFMGGIVGRFMSSFGFTAAFSILVSLLVSFTLTPMLCSRFLKKSSDDAAHHRKSTKESKFYSWIERSYVRLLVWSMKHRLAISLLSIGVVFSSIPLFMLTGKDFIPQDDQSQIEVLAKSPDGTSLRGSTMLVEQLEKELGTLPGVSSILSTVGADAQRQVNFATLSLQLVPINQRKQSQAEIMELARHKMDKYKNDLRVAIQYPNYFSAGGFTNADLLYTIQGPDLERLAEYSEKIRQIVKAIPGVVDINTTLELGKPELRVHINRAKAADLGVDVQAIAGSLRTMVAGEEVSAYREGDNRYEVRLQVALENRSSAEPLSRLYIPSPTIGNVQLSNVVTLNEGVGPGQIDRYNRQRQVTISGNIERGQALSNVLAKLEPSVASLNLDPTYQTGLQGRSRELGRAGLAFILAFLLSGIFMYMVLAAQFESFLHPVTILLSLPMSIPFALISLYAFHQTINIFSSLGILMLFGVVKKNSILQIDHINKLREQGMSRFDAVILGCQDRLRPILMTTFALVAGMLPMAFGVGAGSGMRRSVAIIVIGGQSLCLLLTLLAIPVAYSLFDDLATSPLWSRIAQFASAVRTRFWERLAASFSAFLSLIGRS
ncbi:MAG: efflux RND transporter permease subunit [Terriglobia bacterium]